MTSIRWPIEGQHWALSDTKARRERIATAVMQGLVPVLYSAPNDVLARQAVGLADALIAELDKERSDGE